MEIEKLAEDLYVADLSHILDHEKYARNLVVEMFRDCPKTKESWLRVAKHVSRLILEARLQELNSMDLMDWHEKQLHEEKLRSQLKELDEK